MFTWDPNTRVFVKKVDNVFYYYGEGYGLSDDPKPTIGVANGSKAFDMDQSKMYLFDEENTEWKSWGGVQNV